MGFEVTYKYHEKIEDGSYDMETTQELKKRVGKAYDDTPYERLAAAIMGQFARRDIMVIDVEIEEFIKKKVSFRETKNGIVIKNKKFSFDGSEIELQADEDVPYRPQPSGQLATPYVDQPPLSPVTQTPRSAPIPTTPTIQQQNVPSSGNPFRGKAPLRHEVFEPHQDFMADLKKRNLKFTRGNKYPIYEEKQDRRGIMYGMLYSTIDDEGNKQVLSDKLFVFKQDLIGGTQFDDSDSVSLDYGPGLQSDPSMPAVR